MNKSAIQKFAIWARTELIAQVSQKAYQYGITEEGYGEADAVTVSGHALSSEEAKQRRELVAQIRQKGYTQVMEEVAYTWFNRFIALRFMEVNNYLPSHIRIFSDSTGAFKPEILSDALHLDLPGLDKDKVAAYIENNQTEDLYRYLLLTQCNALNEALPRVFEKMGGYTELLFPNNILKADSVLGRMVADIPEEDWTDQVQIIGWLYQYYISERHEEVVKVLGKTPIRQRDIPAATQLFTTDWVVRYMVDNSLGRYWIERHPESKLREKLTFLVLPKSGAFDHIKEPLKPQEITFLDPCMGSGHILVYAFDVLMEIYKENGYGERDAAAEIVRNNIYGLDIDERCSQLAYFAIMMKARSYDRRFLNRKIEPQVYYPQLNIELKEFGSLVQVNGVKMKPQEPEELTLFNLNYDKQLNDWNYCRLLSQQYSIVCTNPPYLNKYNDILKKYVTENYKEYASDLFSVFMYRNMLLCKPDGYCGYMTPNVWMFIKSYERLRNFLIKNKYIAGLVQMAKGAFFKEATVDICTFILQNRAAGDRLGLYIRLDAFKGDMEVQRLKVLEAISDPNCKFFYETSSKNYQDIENSPIAFWVSPRMRDAFKNSLKIADIAPPKQGLATADNDRFLRRWHETDISKIGFGCTSCENALQSKKKWFPYNKGGAFRRWYGNREYVVNWENDGQEIRNYRDENGKIRSRPRNTSYYFKPSITWSDITSSSFSGRYSENGFIFDVKGSSGFPPIEDLPYILGFLNSSISQECIKILNPTITTQVGDMARIPIIMESINRGIVIDKVNENIVLSKVDWDSYETTWDFKRHPLVRLKLAGAYAWGDKPPVMRLTSIYIAWKLECEGRFEKLKANEEELNRIFIDIYGLQDELTPEIADKDVTVHRIFDTKDDVPESMQGSSYVRTKRDEIVSLISYAVGCMFGRYSLDVEGLAYAGGEWDASKYSTIIPDKDNIIPICDDDYFDDDITGRFVKWVETVYGSDTLEENLKFIADALEGKGTPRDVIRSYFLNGFYADHCKTYQKRPIYWFFDSGKKNGFKALIYMHRYQSDLLARMRTDYVHEQQERYRTQLTHLADALEHASGSERVKLSKQQKTLQDQSLEIQKYEEKIHHLADQNISIDLDDGVKHNYALFADVLAKIK